MNERRAHDEIRELAAKVVGEVDHGKLDEKVAFGLLREGFKTEDVTAVLLEQSPGIQDRYEARSEAEAFIAFKVRGAE